ncbi:MAG: hypothetical protein ACR2IP_13950 [Solirubrobacteraceae bacterium]
MAAGAGRCSAGAGAFAYGFRIEGITGGPLLRAQSPDAPVLHVHRRARRAPVTPHVSAHRADLRTIWGGLALDRAGHTATWDAPDGLADQDLIHPGLWPAAAVFARWHGWETFHGGAFLDRAGGAWGVLGDRGAGKSTLLAALALDAAPVLADDLLVLRAGRAFAGPRCVDLRRESAQALGIEHRSAPVRSTSRLRLPLPTIATCAPLRGWIHLAWGDTVAVEPVPPDRRVELLARHRRVTELGAHLVTLLELAVLPTLLLRRPPHWDSLPATSDTLLAAVAGSHPRTDDLERA